MKTTKKSVAVGTKTTTIKPVKVKAEVPVTPPAPKFTFVNARRPENHSGDYRRTYNLETFNEFCVPQGYVGPCVVATFKGDVLAAKGGNIVEIANKDNPKVKALDGDTKPMSVSRSRIFRDVDAYRKALEWAEYLSTHGLTAADIDATKDFGEGIGWEHTGRHVAVWADGVISYGSGPRLGCLDNHAVFITEKYDSEVLGLPLGSQNPHYNVEASKVQVYFPFVQNPNDVMHELAAVLGSEVFDPRIITDEFLCRFFLQTIVEPSVTKAFPKRFAPGFTEDDYKLADKLDKIEETERASKEAKKASKIKKVEPAAVSVKTEVPVMETPVTAGPPKRAANPTKGSKPADIGPTPLWTSEQVLDWLRLHDKASAARALHKGMHPMTVLNEASITDPGHRAAILTIFAKSETGKTARETLAESAHAIKNENGAAQVETVPTASKTSPKKAKPVRKN